MAANNRFLCVLKGHARRGAPGLSNQEIRQITHYDRNQVVRLMLELRTENPPSGSTARGAPPAIVSTPCANERQSGLRIERAFHRPKCAWKCARAF